MIENSDFNWQCHAAPWEWISSQVQRMAAANAHITKFEKDLEKKIGLRLIDHVDYISPRMGEVSAADLQQWGFLHQEGLYRHPDAIFPGILLPSGYGPEILAIKVESIARFLSVQALERLISGEPHSVIRESTISVEGDTAFRLIQRQGALGLGESDTDSVNPLDFYRVRENWYNRPRQEEGDKPIMDRMSQLAKDQVQAVGRDRAAHLFFQAERFYWKNRNRAAQIICNATDSLGVGLAAHDHHTYRSSRALFSSLIKFFKILGFHRRERFYAGQEAGWGAQVMENPRIGVTLFLDVDLSPGELEIDFVTQGLPSGDRPGTVGLWCALHDDSIALSGMHHLAIRANFLGLTSMMAREKIEFMSPFSRFSYLKQAFTRGEVWTVDEKRVQLLQKMGYISNNEARMFIHSGVLGSHLENIQREEGFKGFSQREVSSIIKETDPLKFNSF